MSQSSPQGPLWWDLEFSIIGTEGLVLVAVFPGSLRNHGEMRYKALRLLAGVVMGSCSGQSFADLK